MRCGRARQRPKRLFGQGRREWPTGIMLCDGRKDQTQIDHATGRGPPHRPTTTGDGPTGRSAWSKHTRLRDTERCVALLSSSRFQRGGRLARLRGVGQGLSPGIDAPVFWGCGGEAPAERSSHALLPLLAHLARAMRCGEKLPWNQAWTRASVLSATTAFPKGPICPFAAPNKRTSDGPAIFAGDMYSRGMRRPTPGWSRRVPFSDHRLSPH